jgi:hypothetical protein
MAQLGIAPFQPPPPPPLFTTYATFFAAVTDIASLTGDGTALIGGGVLSGAGYGNILELSLSLLSDILNIEAANIINRLSNGQVTIDVVLASSSPDAVCPGYVPTFIDGLGFSPNPNNMRVLLVGAIDNQLLRNIIGLRPPVDVGAALRLENDLIQIAFGLERIGSPTAILIPDSVSIGGGLFDDGRMAFNRGWPNVNLGSLPIAGLLVVINVETGIQTGNFAAENVLILSGCG